MRKLVVQEFLTPRRVMQSPGAADDDLTVPDPLRATVDALPEGEYDRERAGAVMRRIQREKGLWRDHSELPLTELDRAARTRTGSCTSW